MAGKKGMSKGNMGGERPGAGRLGQSAKLSHGDKFNGVWHNTDGSLSLMDFTVTRANRRLIELQQPDGTTIVLHRDAVKPVDYPFEANGATVKRENNHVNFHTWILSKGDRRVAITLSLESGCYDLDCFDIAGNVVIEVGTETTKTIKGVNRFLKEVLN